MILWGFSFVTNKPRPSQISGIREGDCVWVWIQADLRAHPTPLMAVLGPCHPWASSAFPVSISLPAEQRQHCPPRWVVLRSAAYVQETRGTE